MHDIVVRNGSVVDGTGSAPVEGLSIAIDGAHITAMGPGVGAGKREINATAVSYTHLTLPTTPYV